MLDLNLNHPRLWLVWKKLIAFYLMFGITFVKNLEGEKKLSLNFHNRNKWKLRLKPGFEFQSYYYFFFTTIILKVIFLEVIRSKLFKHPQKQLWEPKGEKQLRRSHTNQARVCLVTWHLLNLIKQISKYIYICRNLQTQKWQNTM